MGLMDKVKAQAEQALAKAQQGVSEGQAKIEAYQQNKHSRDALLRELGAAYYAWARSGGPQEAIDAAVAAVDAADAAAAAAPPLPAGDAGAVPGATVGGAPAPTPPPASPAMPEGGFNLDDV